MDDVFNSVPFLTKRKAAIEKEMESIEETMAQLGEKYEALEGEWGDKVRACVASALLGWPRPHTCDDLTHILCVIPTPHNRPRWR